MIHTIVSIRRASLAGCAACGPTTPHNVIVTCACGEMVTGRTDHIWTVIERDGDLVTLTPSFAWPEGEAEHLHEFVVRIPDESGKPLE